MPETAQPRITPGSRNDLPEALPGTWRVTVHAGGDDLGHAWISYHKLGEDGKPTGEFHTAGRYRATFGGWAGEEASVSGVQWDIPADVRRTKGERGEYVTCSVIIVNPRPLEGLGFADFTNNCATYARDAWYHHSGQWFWLPGPDRPHALAARIKEAKLKAKRQNLAVPTLRDW